LWFGLGTTLYRFFLFLGIAVAVYHYFFKALGIFLFAVEVWWFILKPVIAELSHWWSHRKRIEMRAGIRLGTILLVALMLLAMPWQKSILAEGWVRAAQEFTVYSPRPARLLYLAADGPVGTQMQIAELDSPDLFLRGARANARISGLDSRLIAATGAEQLMESVRSTREQLSQQWTEVKGADVESRQLQLSSPFAGKVVDVSPELAAGQTIGRQDVLARVIDPSQWIAEVFVDEDDVKRLRIGTVVRAYLHGAQQEMIKGLVDEIDTVPVDQLPTEMLAARHGGFVLTTDDINQLKPRQTLYRVRVALERSPQTQQARLAGFNLEGDSVSLIGRFFRGALSTVVLQANF
jgi:putative peptide zinc metalloprotease protein